MEYHEISSRLQEHCGTRGSHQHVGDEDSVDSEKHSHNHRNHNHGNLPAWAPAAALIRRRGRGCTALLGLRWWWR